MLTRVIINVQNSLAATGAKGAGGLAAQFRSMDQDGDGALTSAEFAEGLKKAGVKVRPVDVAALFQATDINGDGRLAFAEFVDKLCGPLSPHRRSVVEGVWRRIAGSEEEITLSRLLSAYRPEKHPSVEKGSKTPEQIQTDLMEALRPYVKNDSVSSVAFADFHRVGSSFQSDYDFDATQESVWGRAVASEKVDSSEDALAILRKALNERGVRGVVSLARNFRLADQDSSGSLREGEFIRSLQLSQCQLEPKQVSLLFRSFDADRDGVIDQAEFLTKLRGPMNARRVALVDQAFDVLDTDKNGIVEPSEVVAKYDASRHADVKAGKKTERECLREFLDTFDVGGVVDGKVTRQEFRNYYHSVSSGIENDDAFELCIRNAWHLAGGEGWCANSTNLRVLVTHADGTQTVECVEDDLGLEMPRDAVEIIDRLRKQGLDVVSVQSGAGPVISKPIPVVEEQHERVSNEEALDTLRKALKKRGVRGLTNLGRAFRIADADHSRVLSKEELQRCLHRADVYCEDFEAVYSLFDKDGNGKVDYDEFLRTLRGPMGDRRRALVDQAFAVLDIDQNGIIEPSEVVRKYDASQHPDVLKGDKTEDQVLREFLDTFDVGGVVYGKVTRGEFENYYENVSCSIDDDDYFELMIRNAWHLSGGEGWCANTSNLRVLVTHADGSQSVECVEDDLGLQMPRDAPEILRRLRRQGIDCVAVDSPTAHYAEPAPEVDNSDVTPACVEAMCRRGARGFIILKRRLNARSNNGEVSRDGFLASCRDAGVSGSDATDAQLRGVFEGLQSQGRAPLRKCLEALTPPLTTQRRNLAQSAFSRLDVDGLNRVAPQSLIAAFDATRHPDVISGKQSPQDAVDDLLAAFSGSASVEVFCDYHCAVGAISDDATFERFVRNAWRTSMTESNRAAGASSPQRGRKVIQGGVATGGPSLPGKSTPLRRRRGASPAPRVDTGVTTVVEKLRESVLFNGARGIAQLERSLRDEASDNSRDLTFDELSRSCRSLGLSSQELRLLFDACDVTGEGTADYASFVSLVAPPLTGSHLLAVKDTWRRCFGDVDSVPPERVAQAFDASRHPEVVAGRSTDKKQFAAFLDMFDVPGSSAQMDDFLAYHRGVCAAAPNGEYFLAVVNDVWQTPNAKPSEVKPLASFERKPTSPVRSAGVPLRRVGEVTFGDDTREVVLKPKPRSTQKEMDPGVARLLFDLRTQLASHGARGIGGLGRKFRICDDDNDGKLSHSEFNKAINELGLAELTSQERRVLFDHFDRDGSGSLSYEEFLSNVRGPLAQPRIDIIDAAFDILDLDKDGSILPDEIALRFDASQHPDVLQGKCTQQDVYRDFLDTFDVGGVKDHRVTRQEFRNYYHNVSCSIDSDAYFVQMVRNAWHMGAKSTTALRVLVTHSDNTRSVECVEDDLGLQMPRDADIIVKKLRTQGIDCISVEGPGGKSVAKLADNNTPKTFRDVRRHAAAGGGARPKSSGRRVGGYRTNAFDSNVSIGHAPLPPPPPRSSSKPPYVTEEQPRVDINKILRKARSKLRFLGARGVHGMVRKLRSCGDKAGVLCDTLALQRDDAMALAASDDLITKLRGDLSETRLVLVDAAFDALDYEGEGSVALTDVVQNYDAASHPEVLAGARTREAAKREFLETFEVDGDRASLQNFREYYANVSAAVDDDALFATLVRNAWRLSVEKQSPRGVHALVTHRDGRQSVEVLSEDGEDALEMLRSRGVDAIDVKLNDKNTRTFRSTLVLE